MAKQTRKTATKRTTTGRGRGGGGGQSMGYDLTKQVGNRLGKLWNNAFKQHQKTGEILQQLKTELGPMAKIHGIDLEGATTQRRTATRRNTTARTGRRNQQQESLTASA
jgi:hypothetical protein